MYIQVDVLKSKFYKAAGSNGEREITNNCNMFFNVHFDSVILITFVGVNLVHMVGISFFGFEILVSSRSRSHEKYFLLVSISSRFEIL